MSELSVTKITDRVGTGKVNFSQGFKVAGTLDTTLAPTRTEGNTEPATPVNGDTWYDTDNDTYDVYINDEWKRFLGAGGGGDWTVNLSNVTYDNVSFSVSSQESGLYGGPAFSSDGTKMYVNGYMSDSTHQYTLSTAWDLSTASYDSVSFGGQGEGSLTGVRFKPDGLKMYFIGYTSDRTYEVDLSTAYDLSTATYNSVNYAHGGGGQAQGLFFGADGTKLYTTDVGSDDVREHTLSTAWDLSTASYVRNFSVSTQTGTPRDVTFNSDGTQMIILSQSGLILYTLSTAWDISSASYTSINTSVLSQGDGTGGMSFSADGSKMYLSADSTDTIYQYSTGL